MQYYPNDNLAVRARRQPLSVTEVLRVGIQISSAVETAHRAGVLHRDIKPANVLTSEFGDPGLTDFGIAGATAVSAEEQNEGLSIPWSPPEAFESSVALDERSDVYSLAATTWHLLAGRSPFEDPGGNNSALMLLERIERSPVPSTGRPDVPPQLERVLAQAMSKNPDLRHSSALLFARDLQAVEQSLHLKMTTIVVPSELQEIRTPGSEVGGDEDSTRGRILQKVDPFAPPDSTSQRPKTPVPITYVPAASASAAFVLPATPMHDDRPPARPRAVADEVATQSRPRQIAASDEAEAAEVDLQPRSKRAFIAAASVVGVMVVALVIVLALSGSPAKNAATAGVTGGTSLIIVPAPTPTSVTATLTGPTQVTVTWSNPHPIHGDYYEVTEFIGGQASVSEQFNSTSGLFKSVPSGVHPCYTVVLQRQDGQASSPSSPSCTSG
jgi:hypothetical protein